MTIVPGFFVSKIGSEEIMRNQRIRELQELAYGGDDEIKLLVESEFALLPESQEEKQAALDAYVDRVAESFAAPAAPVDEAKLDELAKEADF